MTAHHHDTNNFWTLRAIVSSLLLLTMVGPSLAQDSSKIGVIKVRKQSTTPLGNVLGVWQLQGISDCANCDFAGLDRANQILKFLDDERFALSVIREGRGQTYHGMYALDSEAHTVDLVGIRKGMVGPKQPDRYYKVARLTIDELVLEETNANTKRWLHFQLLKEITNVQDVY